MRQKRTRHTIIVLIMAIIFLMTMMAGCDGKKDDATNEPTEKPTAQVKETDAVEATEEAVKQDPLELSVFSVYYSTEYPDLDDSLFSTFEELMNVKIEWDLVPNGNLVEKFDVKLASRDLAMINRISSVKAPNVVSAVENGAFWVVEDYLDDNKYPNLALLSDEIIAQSKVNGKYAFLTSERPIGRPAVLYRKDIAEAHGITETPKTIDDFYNLIVALSEDCEYGITLSQILPPNNQWVEFSRMAVWFGAPNGYGIVDGKLAYAPTTQGWIDAMDFVKKLYDEDLINKDFAAINDSQTREIFKSGKAGAIHLTAGSIESYEQLVQEIDPEAELDGFGELDAGYGTRAILGTGQGEPYGLSKDEISDEDTLGRVLAFLDACNTPEMKGLMSYGIVGTHCSWVEEGKTVEWMIEREQIYQTCSVLSKLNMNLNAVTGIPSYIEDPRAIAMRAESVESGIMSAVTPYTSETYNTVGVQLDNIVVDATTKYIFGELDLDGYNAEMDKWLSQGGDKIIEEYQTQYDQFN